MTLPAQRKNEQGRPTQHLKTRRASRSRNKETCWSLSRGSFSRDAPLTPIVGNNLVGCTSPLQSKIVNSMAVLFPHRYEPIAVAPLRLVDVTDETARMDKLLAAPTDRALKIMWAITCVSTSLVVLSCLLVLFAILRKRTVRSLPFNLYVVFLVLPDLVLAALCFLNCALNFSVGHYYSEWWCRFQTFYHVAGGKCSRCSILPLSWRLTLLTAHLESPKTVSK